jgi:predicted AlkP superfamily phosphohydrolase/phosphomutase
MTRAFSEEWRGNVWLNVEGRDPLGVVAQQEEYTALREEIAAKLLAALDPKTSTPLIHRVWKREELFAGPYLNLIPDLLLETNVPAIFRRTPQGVNQGIRVVDAAEMGTFRTSGDHRYEGVLIAWGPGILPGQAFSGATLQDIVPTILYWLEEPIPSDLDGRLLTECFGTDVMPAHPMIEGDPVGAIRTQPQQGYTPTDEVAVEERLKGLGYLE